MTHFYTAIGGWYAGAGTACIVGSFIDSESTGEYNAFVLLNDG